MVSTNTKYAERIKTLREELGLTQTEFAKLVGVSFATVNRWENSQSAPSKLAWEQIVQAETGGLKAFDKAPNNAAKLPTAVTPGMVDTVPTIDFSADPMIVKAVAEGERLSFGHLFNPTFATEISMIEPLPHQRIAVYERILKQPRVRVLLADDAGAGKTIMAGLTIREMSSRRLVRRVLIVAPAGLLGNWERELRTLFSLKFKIITGADLRNGNPFTGPDSNFVIVSLDTIRGESMFTRLQDPAVAPYDLAIFDEAHKLSADREQDFSTRKTDRYKLAESLSGIHSFDPRWTLSWSCPHLMLLTATPHMGRDYPYYFLWRLLEPEVLSTVDAFNAFPPAARQRYFIRRTKEEMVNLDGTPLYPVRQSDTLSYDLTQGEISEQTLYEQTTAYIQTTYNTARIFNRSAASMAMGVFQRRLASSTFALLKSFERRIAKLEELIADIESGRLSPDDLRARQQRAGNYRDVFEDATGDEEDGEGGREENEIEEDKVFGGVVAVSLVDLQNERQQVVGLKELAQKVLAKGDESKFNELWKILQDEKFRREKLLIFSEHRDTLNYIVRRLEGMGFAGKIAQIHGGMDYKERQEQVDFFRRTASDNGATYMVCTDAAAEGINLQFCGMMVNYDVPWNPARLEQRMGRIHRYGQKREKVFIINLIAGKTREGRVLQTLLEKLERIRKELRSDKVFDVVGRLFEGVSIKEYMQAALTESGADESVRSIEGRLTPEQIAAIAERERRLYGQGGDVRPELARLRRDMEHELYRRLLPGYVRSFVASVAPLIGLDIVGDTNGFFAFRSQEPQAMDPLLPAFETYASSQRQRLTVYKPKDKDEAIFLHPGEPVFERLRTAVTAKFAAQALRGAVFADPEATNPYMLHLAVIPIVRKADPSSPPFMHEETLECRLVGFREAFDGRIQTCPVEHMLLLRSNRVGSIPADIRQFAATANDSRKRVTDYATHQVAMPIATQRRRDLFDTLPAREDYIVRGFDYLAAELAAQRARLSDKARDGDPKAKGAVTKIRDRQRLLQSRRDTALQLLRQEPELIVPGILTFIAHALVVPSTDPMDRMRHDAEVEKIAVRVARSYEEAAGADVKDVSKPELARAVGLDDWPGFDLLSLRSRGDERAIEVKGRAQIGDVEMKENEWARACNLRHRYWLYVVYDCASAHPRLLRIQDPFGKLLVKARGGVIIDEKEILKAAEHGN